jgi:hypothetical protein
MLYGMQLKTTTSVNIPDYQKYLLKIVETIRKSIFENISETDEFHKKLISRHIEHIINIIKNKDEKNQNFEQSLIAKLFEIIFLLIGELPNNIGRSIDGEKELTNKHIWRLNNYRNVQYTQNNTQKRNLIFHFYDLGINSNSEIKTEYLKKKYFDFKCNDKVFVDWFKKEHPDQYVMIF